MANFNQVILIGNITRDPELRVTPKGTSICQFGIAVNRQYKDESGQTREDVSFFDVEAWGKQGEVIAKYLAKGRQIFVQGRLKQDSWDDKTTGSKRTKIKVVLENFQFIGSREGGAPGGNAGEDSGEQSAPAERSAPPPRGPAARNTPPPPPQDNIDEDVPF